MNEIQNKLTEFAVNTALPYLKEHYRFKDHLNQISFVLVGSTATGFCTEESDVDIAIVCPQSLFSEISHGTNWLVGRPSEEIIDGIQLHYYTISFEQIEAKYNELDDLYLYVYSNSKVLHDSLNQYESRIINSGSRCPEKRIARIEKSLVMLMRRSNALKYCISHNADIIVLSDITLELIKLSLKVTALLDDVSFEPRKRLFATALKGKLGTRLEEDIRQLFNVFSTIGIGATPLVYPQALVKIINLLSEEAKLQGIASTFHD